MKAIQFTIIFILLFGTVSPQVVVHGYCITLNNDTLRGNLKLASYFNKINWEKIQRKIKYIDSVTKKEAKFKPADINGYCFYWKNDLYCYKSLFANTSHVIFSRQIASGKRASLFYSITTGYKGSQTSFYYIQKNNGGTLNITSATKKGVKELLLNLFSADSAARDAINAFSFARKSSLKTLVDAINDQ